MKKIFTILFVLTFFFLVIPFSLLFTKFGNSIIVSYIESRVNSSENFQFKVNNFELTFNRVIFNATGNDGTSIDISGDLLILKEEMDLKYELKIIDLSKFEDLIYKELKGFFYTNGTIKGNEKNIIIQGFTNIANSFTTYNFNFVDFRIKDLFFDLKDAKIDELLTFLNKPKFIKGELTLKADIKNIDINNFEGIFNANISKAFFNSEVINKEFKKSLSSNINFDGAINASLLGNNAEIKSEFISSVFDLFMDKTLIDFKKNILTSDYKIEVKNLSKLENIIGKKINQEFLALGNLSYENNLIYFDGFSNIFESTTNYKVSLKDLNIQNLSFKIKNAKLEKIFHFLNEPVYALGDLDIEGDIKNLNQSKMEGLVVSKISNAKLISDVINATFNQQLKENINFNLDLTNDLLPNKVLSKAFFSSTLANLDLYESIYDIKDNFLKASYSLNIPSLILLKDLIKIKLRGKMNINGEIEKRKNNLEITGKSETLGGKLDFISKNSDLNINFKNINFKELLYMVHQNEIFDSKANINLNYNSELKNGNLNLNLFNGYFLPNDFSSLLKGVTRVDLTKEIFENVNITGLINENKLVYSFDFLSKNSEITSENSFIDFEKSLIESKINTKIKENNFIFMLNGDLYNPNFSIDTKETLKGLKLFFK